MNASHAKLINSCFICWWILSLFTTVFQLYRLYRVRLYDLKC
jgi:hypothetical protein